MSDLRNKHLPPNAELGVSYRSNASNAIRNISRTLWNDAIVDEESGSCPTPRDASSPRWNCRRQESGGASDRSKTRSTGSSERARRVVCRKPWSQGARRGSSSERSGRTRCAAGCCHLSRCTDRRRLTRDFGSHRLTRGVCRSCPGCSYPSALGPRTRGCACDGKARRLRT